MKYEGTKGIVRNGQASGALLMLPTWRNQAAGSP